MLGDWTKDYDEAHNRELQENQQKDMVDARRYRWLREHAPSTLLNLIGMMAIYDYYADRGRQQQIDTMIDAAIKNSK